jgi:hypothetical protein
MEKDGELKLFIVDRWYIWRVARTLLMLDFLAKAFDTQYAEADLDRHFERVRSGIVSGLSTIGVTAALFTSFTFPLLASPAADLNAWPQAGFKISVVLAFFTAVLATIGCAAFITLVSFIPSSKLRPILNSVRVVIALPLLCLEGSFILCSLAVLFTSEASDATGRGGDIKVFVRVIVGIAIMVPTLAVLLFAAINPVRLKKLFAE